MGVLIDSFGRRITSLRISITSQCNLNCYYCHNEGQSGGGTDMKADQIVNIVNAAANFGVDRIKFSGGEPLLRKDFEDILADLPKLKNVSATTNGVLLAPRAAGLKAAGLDRVNISLDTLNPKIYASICRCTENIHQRVLEGVHAAVDAGLTPVKLNSVILDGINSGELDDLITFIRQYDGNVILQIIEPINFDKPGIMEYIEKQLTSRASSITERIMHRRKKFKINGVEVELVRPIDNSKFCANCNRLRVTADGKLKPCLLRNDNLVDASQAGKHELESLLIKAVSNREPYFKADQDVSR